MRANLEFWKQTVWKQKRTVETEQRTETPTRANRVTEQPIRNRARKKQEQEQEQEQEQSIYSYRDSGDRHNTSYNIT
jgi:hypothetical protein